MKIKLNKLLSILLITVMMVSMLVACKAKVGTQTGDEVSGGNTTDAPEDNGTTSGEEITLTVYSQLANFSGELQGWFAKVLHDKFNVKLIIVPETGGIYETRMETGDLGDIVIWGSDDTKYLNAVAQGMLYDWNEDSLLQEYGPYIAENMKYALEKNTLISAEASEQSGDEEGAIYGFGHNVAPTAENHEAFFYTWDLRWDLYEQLGRPEVKNLDDMVELFVKMKEIAPTDDNGNPTYAMSLWPDWDGTMVMYVKAMATAYYGYDEHGIGLYDPSNGEFHDALKTDGPYLEMLKFFNTLYQKGLLDPNSMTQTYDTMIEKVQNGGTFFSIFDYAGSLAYNGTHAEENKMMMPFVPTEAAPIVYGMNVYGGNRVWSIGSNTAYPEICMEIINYLSTPEGRLTSDYGPKGLCWDYDENGKTYFTELGKQCQDDRTTIMPAEWGATTFNEGANQMNNTTWSSGAINPESGERYDSKYWNSNQVEPLNDTEASWRSWSGTTTVQEYMDTTNYKVAPGTTFAAGTRSDELEVVWEQVTECIVNYSWNAIYAKTDEEFDKIVAEMKGKCMQYGYNQCLEWSLQKAAERNALEEPLR